MKLIENQGALSIDKAEIDELLAAGDFIGLNKSPRPEKVIVSLTSYKPRINHVKYAIYSLLNQTFPPDELILWLDEDSFPRREEDLPQDLLKLKDFGLTIAWCENLRSYKKLIPALELFPEDIIVTADDDIFYRPEWLAILYDAHLDNPDSIIAHRAHRIRLDLQGIIFPYTAWQLAVKPAATSELSSSNFFTGGAGALYKRNFLHDDVLRRELFLNLAPTSDDIWFWAMAVLNGTRIVIPASAQRDLIAVDLDAQRNGETLWNVNKTQNDVNLRRVIETYPEILDKLIRESVEFKPKISVVLPITDSSIASSCLENLFAQTFPDFEFILVNCGSRLQVPTLPTNFQIINYPGGTIADALNLGLQKSAGEYVLFKDETSFLLQDSLEVAADLIELSGADVIHFEWHYQVTGDDSEVILDDALKFDRATPVFLGAPKQIRAGLWLQNKLSRRLDTKLFKKEFLTRHEIKFSDEISEFLFQALIGAEKYLLVPQAFCATK